jgi:hypothetical protein
MFKTMQQLVGYTMIVIADVLGEVGSFLYMGPHIEQCAICGEKITEAVDHEAHAMIERMEAAPWN